MSADTIRRRLLVHGRVQGVFYRDSTREAAENEGVSGWARNCSDGSVEVVLEGPPAGVEAVLEFCRRGPPRAHVTGVEVSDDETPEGLAGFKAR